MRVQILVLWICVALSGMSCGVIGTPPHVMQPGADASATSDASVDADAGDAAGTLANCNTMTSKIDAPEDDGEFFGPMFYPSGDVNSLGMGHWNNYLLYGYFRFALPQALPSNATIGKVTLSLWGIDVSGDWVSGNAFLKVSIEDVADAMVVGTTDRRPGGKSPVNLAVRTVRWPATGGLNWNLNTWNDSPNLGAMIQHLVDSRSGLAMGNYVQFWIDYPSPTSPFNGSVGTEDRSVNGGHEAKLSISWCP